MRISIRYYSGAGNTQFIARKMARGFAAKAHEVDCLKIKANDLEAPVDSNFDMLGLGFPIYFRDAPQLVYELLNRLDGQGRTVFLFTTKGMYSGDAMRKVMRACITRHLRPVAWKEFYMPGTDVLILFTPKNSLMENLLKRIHSRRMDEKIYAFIARTQKVVSAKIPARKWYVPIDDGIVKKMEIRYDNHHRDYIGQTYLS